MTDVSIRPFRPGDQKAVRALILAGLSEHFERIDPSLNPDLDDILGSYLSKGDCFLVAEYGNTLIGTGALIRESADTGRIVRMSVAVGWRRQGIAYLLVQELLASAQRSGFRNIVVETNDDWHGAIQLYQSCGFQPYDHRSGEFHMQRELGAIN